MTELRDAEPITFDASAAERLADRFRATAGVLRSQVYYRGDLALAAREEWRGVYEVEFEKRMKICARDAERLAEAMVKAAQQVEELARLANEEQARRAVAREWKRAHDEWQRRKDHQRGLGDLHDFLLGDGEPDPPNLIPNAPPTIPIVAAAPSGPR